MIKLIGCMWVLGALFSYGTTFETADHFSISLQEGWVDIPKAVLDEEADGLAELIPDGLRQGYDYGYQLKGYDDGLYFPYILVQVNTAGRISAAELKQYKVLTGGGSEGSRPIADFLSDVSGGEPVYDEAHQLLWSSTTIPVDGGGSVKMLVADKLTENGVLRFMGYASSGMFDSYAELYRRAFRGVEVDESIVYQPRFYEVPLIGGLSGSTLLAAALNGAVAGGIIWFAMALRKKRTISR